MDRQSEALRHAEELREAGTAAATTRDRIRGPAAVSLYHSDAWKIADLLVEYADLLATTEDADARQRTGCYDCGREYGDEHGFADLLVPNWAWAIISPTGHDGGLLCPSCIVRRCAAAGLKVMPATFASGPLYLVLERDFDIRAERPQPAPPQRERASVYRDGVLESVGPVEDRPSAFGYSVVLEREAALPHPEPVAWMREPDPDDRSDPRNAKAYMEDCMRRVSASYLARTPDSHGGMYVDRQHWDLIYRGLCRALRVPPMQEFGEYDARRAAAERADG